MLCMTKLSFYRLTALLEYYCSIRHAGKDSHAALRMSIYYIYVGITPAMILSSTITNYYIIAIL